MPDPKDVVFYAVTLSAQDKDAFLVTGNGLPLILRTLLIFNFD